jgi:excisionase family DNA binding protein
MAVNEHHRTVEPTPSLLTVEEAAVIARCSTTTVRRAYRTGALTAYRRRGSRAVLLDPRDVSAWTQGQLVAPDALSMKAPPHRPHTATTAPTTRTAVRAGAFTGPPRFDLSAEALGDRRAAHGHRHA